MQAMLDGTLPYAAIAKTLDFTIIEVGPGRAVFQGQPGAQHLNPLGTVHGGWFATLLDSALGCAVHTMMPAGRAYTTAELGINLVKALTPKVARVRAIGQVLHCGRQLATAEARLVGADGTLYAHATTTCLVFDLPPARVEVGAVAPRCAAWTRTTSSAPTAAPPTACRPPAWATSPTAAAATSRC